MSEKISVVVSSTTLEKGDDGRRTRRSVVVAESGGDRGSGDGSGGVGGADLAAQHGASGADSIDPGDPGTFTAYVVEVQVGAAVWAVKRRYKQFRDLADALEANYPTMVGNGMPPFPPKKFLNHTADDAEERRQAFQVYLQAIVAIPLLRVSWYIQYFLELRAHLGGGPKRRVVCPLPARDLDPAEAGVVWHIVRKCEGFEIVFATPDGAVAEADPRMLKPNDVAERRLAAEWEPRLHFLTLTDEDENYAHPIRYTDIRPEEYDGMLLLGGLSSAITSYVEDAELQAKVAEFWQLERPVGAIDHGVLLLALTKDPNANGDESIIRDCKVTCLTKNMQQAAYTITRWAHDKLYRPYERWTQFQVADALNHGTQVNTESAVRRGTAYVDTSALTVVDGRLVTARWQGDAFLFARKFAQLLHDFEYPSGGASAGAAEGTSGNKGLPIPGGAGAPMDDDAPYGSL